MVKKKIRFPLSNPKLLTKFDKIKKYLIFAFQLNFFFFKKPDIFIDLT